MAMNRPRPSVLQLFDPLSSRDAPSPESDKENSLPDFFLQPYVKHPSPVRLTRRLVEVGDVTVDFGGAEDAGEGRDGKEEDDDEEGNEEDENDTIRRRHPPSPRTPLVDVTFDRDQTPMRSKMYRRKPDTSVVTASNPIPDEYAAMPVVDMDAVDVSEVGGAHVAPVVVICSPDDSPASSNGHTDALSTSFATLSLATPTGSLIADTTLAFPTPSEASTSLAFRVPTPSEASTSLLVPNTLARAQPPPAFSVSLDQSSADMHASFALHMNMNGAETSFDLLNDQISFFGQGDEESFEMEGGLGLFSEQEDASESGASSTLPELVVPPDNVAQNTDVKSSSGRASPMQLSDLSQAPPNTVDQDSCASSAISPQPPSLAPVFVAPPARQSPPIPVLSTSLPQPPALIPALKIVKRKRPDTTATPKPSEDLHSGVPRTAPAMVPPAGRYVTEGPGPWRVPISGGDKEKAAVTGRSQKPVSGTTLPGPRRVPLPTQAPAPVPAPAPAPASMKAPSQVTQAAGGLGLKRPLRAVPPNGSASSLPRAVGGSRLPMPKSKIAAPSGTGLPRRRVA
ncbi:hypothetical protein C8R44DRAFT_801036 [Mycena epipterygia]|nr:hypothetical protein C8R44DRAFT_801036 [Mycena epipterygia]